MIGPSVLREGRLLIRPRRVFWRAIALGVVWVALVSVNDSARDGAVAATRELPPEATASCDEASASTDPQWQWRDKARTAGPFGLYGPGRKLPANLLVERPDGSFGAKIPAILEGHRAVALRVPERNQDRVRLDYGDLTTDVTFEEGLTEIVFEPCEDRTRTAWPGGLAVKSRRAVTVTVQVEGWSGPRPLRVGKAR